MNKGIQLVIDFQRATSSPVVERPKLPPLVRSELRISLLKEEVKEFEDAVYDRNLTEVLDALVDIQYILYGTVIEFGLQDIFTEAFNEVHASNMSKFTKTTADARESVARYMDKNVDAYYKKVGDRHVIMRSEDNKILKGMHYFSPRLKEILKDHIRTKKENKEQESLSND